MVILKGSFAFSVLLQVEASQTVDMTYTVTVLADFERSHGVIMAICQSKLHIC